VVFWIEAILWNLIERRYRKDSSWKKIFRPSRYFLNTQALLQLLYFIYVLFSTEKGSVWNKYQEIGARLMNSGYTTLLSNLLFMQMYYYEKEEEDAQPDSSPVASPSPGVQVTIGSHEDDRAEASGLSVVMIGHFLTHCLIGLFAFFWVLMIALVPWIAIYYLINVCLKPTYQPLPQDEETPPVPRTTETIWEAIWFRLFVCAMGIFVLQLSYNYAISLYNGQYLGALETDAHLRNNTCYFSLVFSQPRHILTFISLFI